MIQSTIPPLSVRSLYIHFPFCESKCHYCDFYSLGVDRTRPKDAEQFEAALRQECARQAHLLAPEVDTLFLGGGTPSMTPPESMARALEPLGLQSRITSKTEWTMEANPSSITLEKMKSYRDLGINRISMGVQSMVESQLSLLGRVHSRQTALKSLEAIFAAGFNNVSVDLLCGVPGQTLSDLDSAMNELTQYPITHLSCYLLTLPKHHAMYKDLPNDETQLQHLLFIDQKMRNLGFEHYEISNFAKPGKQAQHNLAYWKGASYLGLGPSAHSFDSTQSIRWKNFSSLHRYVQFLQKNEPVVEWSESLREDQLKMERWMLNLRLAEGFPISWLDTPLRQSTARELQLRGLLEDHPHLPGRKRLTATGFALSDQVIAALV